MPARRTKRPDGRYSVTLTFEDADGAKRRGYFYGRTQAEARNRAETARRRLAEGGPVRDASRTLSDWLEEWRTTFLRASDRAESTKVLYRGLTLRHVESVIGSIRLDQLKPTDVTRLLLGMEEAGKAASTRRNTYAALRGALDDAVANGLLGSNPVLRVKRPKADHVEAQSLGPEEVAAFLVGIRGLRYAPVLRLILGTGLRRGEALAIRWDDVNLTRQELSVKGSLVRLNGSLVVAEPKTARSRRVVSLSPAMVGLLRAQKAAQAEERLTSGNLWRETGYVFATEFGEPADPRNLLRAVRIASGKVGLPTIGVHTLRHTYATTALLNGVPVHVVSRNLGHSSIVLTVDTYGHLTDEASKAAAETVSTVLGL